MLVVFLLLVVESFNKVNRYFEVIYLAKFVEISVGDSKFLDILEIGFT